MANESLILNPNSRQVGSMLGYKPVPQETNPNAVLPIEIPFTRGSVGMEYVNGLWQEAAINKPRRYNDAYLFEPAATNICQRNTKLATSPWTTSNISINETSITAPDGTLTGNKITLLSGAPSALERTSQNFTLNAGLTYTFSCFVKAGDFTGVMLLRGDVNGNTASLSYNFTTGVVSSSGANIINVSKQVGADGWVRLILVFTTVLNPTIDINVFNGQQLNKFYYAWGAQLESGRVATSLIITEGAAKDRLNDNVPVKSISSIKTWFVEVVNNIETPNSGTHVAGTYITNGTQGLFLATTTTERLRLWTVAAGSVFQTTANYIKLAVVCNGVTVDVWQNGVKVVTGYSYPYLFDRLGIHPPNIPLYIKQQKTFNVIPSDAELTALTTL
jgi:hypothetical protein